MADRDSEQENLFKEIDEDLRQQKYAELWKKYNKLVIGSAILLVIGVASIKGWQAYDLNRKATDSTILTSALALMNDTKPEKALPLLEKLASGGTYGYSVLAEFNKAATIAKTEGNKASLDAYLAIANNKNVDRVYRDLAIVLSAQIGVGEQNSQKFVEKLAKIIDDQSPWRHMAKELLALIERQLGNKKKSLTLFNQLSDDATAPPGIRSRAAEMAAILGNRN